MIDQIVQDIALKGYCSIEHLLEKHQLRDINHFIEANRDQFTPAMVGPKDKKVRMESIRGDYTFWLDPLAPHKEFSDLMKFLDELKKALNENFFLGLKQYECHLASYPAGSFYQKHSDRFEASSSRYLSFVFYLNESWEPDYGGTLVLYEKNGSPIDTIFPLPGSFICFLSEDFPHEVQAAKFERRSLTGWMHNKLIY